jgi:hypothetical protein
MLLVSAQGLGIRLWVRAQVKGFFEVPVLGLINRVSVRVGE